MMRGLLLLGGFIAAVTPATAFAQSAAGSGGSPSLSEIVVTAQRREEKLKDVPVSVSAFSQEALVRANVTNASGLTQITPGLNFYANQIYAQPVIRGINSTSGAPGDSSNVALYVDGIYQPTQYTNFFTLVDAESVQVLKGPQGTLYGRNAAGGAIVITTRDPKFHTVGQINLGYARFNERKASGFVTGPIIEDKLAGSFSFSLSKDDGFKRDIVRNTRLGDTEEKTFRAKLLWRLGESTDVILGGDYIDNSGNAVFSGQPYRRNAVVRQFQPNVVIPDAPNRVALSFDPPFRTKTYSESVRIKSELGGVNINSVTGYRHAASFLSSDSDATTFPASHLNPQISKSSSFIQEVVLTSSSTGRLHWLAGAMYLDEDGSQYSRTQTGTPPAYTTVKSDRESIVYVHNRSVAAYAEINYDITDRLQGTVGARYTRDRVTYHGLNLLTNVPVAPDGPLISKQVTPRASLRYALSDRVNTYATYSRGFKAAVFPVQSLGLVPVKPEVVTSYEVGLKGDITSTLSTNAAVFYYDYKNLQVQSYGETRAVILLTNAAAARVKGAEFEANYSPTRNFNVRASVAYTDAKYKSFPGAQGFFPIVQNGVEVGGNVASKIDASGKRMARQPKFTGSILAEYTVPLASGELRLSGNYYYASRTYYDAANLATQGGYSLLNARVTWASPNDRYKVSVYANNLLNEKYFASFLVSTNGWIVNYGRPVTAGVSLTYNFGD